MEKSIDDLKVHWDLMNKTKEEQLVKYCQNFIVLNNDVIDTDRLEFLLKSDNLNYSELERELANCFDKFEEK